MNYQELQDLGQKGKPIFEKVPKETRQKWALKFLELVDKKFPYRPKPVKDLYEIVEDERRWAEAYNQFQRIRDFSLSNPNFDPEEYLILAERISKVTYNQTNPKAPFDHDSGWAIPYLALEIARKIDDKELGSQIKELISKKK